MRISKRIISAILCCTISICLNLSFVSAEEYIPPITITPVSDNWEQMRDAYNTFDISDTGMATMSATTDGYFNSTEVTVSMYLERLQNGKWTTVSGMSWSSSKTTTSTVTLNKSRAVVSGYNYRLRSEHSATGPNGTDSTTVYSVMIYY